MVVKLLKGESIIVYPYEEENESRNESCFEAVEIENIRGSLVVHTLADLKETEDRHSYKLKR